ncbi:2-keto-4-pentenoate hydratase [Acidisoma cellulosilytica]|uniref:2-keto-4-pentenoate hydratase n=1 Tax=Acidisoma cellulosilyticum TaxID=2802395 RepID=A0A963Z1X3_9PROT|nr:2-keto-4-pentenoate hydratase [Acidisoma cellulosilyticum]MCB8881006.1 2-keto-4-pentenoate hydratase [Acidisoma cellulosilyticum]
MTEAEGYAVQVEVTSVLGEIGGWKVGAPGPDAPPSCAPLPAAGILPSGTALDARFSDRLVEAEIAFMLAADLPPRDAPYSRAEVIAAIGSCHSVIEIVQWRIRDYATATNPVKLADSTGNGALIVGDAIEGWQAIDFPNLTVTQDVEGEAPKLGKGNPGGDMIRLIAWLADVGTVWAGGLKAGQIVTCGSWTGCLPAPAGAGVSVTFAGQTPVRTSFA